MPYMFKHISRGVYALHVQTHLKRCVCLTCTKTHSSVTQVSTHTKEIFLFIYFVIQDQHSHLIKRLPSKIKLYLYQHWNGMPPTDRASETKRFCTTSNQFVFVLTFTILPRNQWHRGSWKYKGRAKQKYMTNCYKRTKLCIGSSPYI